MLSISARDSRFEAWLEALVLHEWISSASGSKQAASTSTGFQAQIDGFNRLFLTF